MLTIYRCTVNANSLTGDEQSRQVLPKSVLGKAIGYALTQWARLIRYTEHGMLEIDNTSASIGSQELSICRLTRWRPSGGNYLFTRCHR